MAELMLKPIICKWQTARILLRCNRCHQYIYPGHLVWFEDMNKYCYRCGSRRQDDLHRRLRENTLPYDEAVKRLQDYPRTVGAAAAGPEVGIE